MPDATIQPSNDPEATALAIAYDIVSRNYNIAFDADFNCPNSDPASDSRKVANTMTAAVIKLAKAMRNIQGAPAELELL